MFCKKCGEKLVPNSAFCKKCGNPTEWKGQNGFQNDADYQAIQADFQEADINGSSNHVLPPSGQVNQPEQNNTKADATGNVTEERIYFTGKNGERGEIHATYQDGKLQQSTMYKIPEENESWKRSGIEESETKKAVPKWTKIAGIAGGAVVVLVIGFLIGLTVSSGDDDDKDEDRSSIVVEETISEEETAEEIIETTGEAATTEVSETVTEESSTDSDTESDGAEVYNNNEESLETQEEPGESTDDSTSYANSDGTYDNVNAYCNDSLSEYAQLGETQNILLNGDPNFIIEFTSLLEDLSKINLTRSDTSLSFSMNEIYDGPKYYQNDTDTDAILHQDNPNVYDFKWYDVIARETLYFENYTVKSVNGLCYDIIDDNLVTEEDVSAGSVGLAYLTYYDYVEDPNITLNMGSGHYYLFVRMKDDPSVSESPYSYHLYEIENGTVYELNGAVDTSSSTNEAGESN